MTQTTAALSLYLIKRTDEVGYDEYAGYVIAARHVTAVRRIAAHGPGDEGEGPWFDDTRSTVTLIGTAAAGVTEGVLLSDSCAG